MIPERKTDIEEIIKGLEEKEKRRKLVNLIVVAEGDELGGGDHVAKIITERTSLLEVRVCILGHIQRGGSPVVLTG